jgi:hypothetical protein
LRHEQLLCEVISDAEGSYELHYRSTQFRRPQKSAADLIVRAYNAANVLLAASTVIFHAPPVAEVDLLVERPEDVEPSEYEQLLIRLAPVLESVTTADLTADDVVFLAHETGIAPSSVELIRASAQLAQRTNLPPGMFYGFARRGLPVDLETLAALPVTELVQALRAGIDQHLVPVALRADLGALAQRLKQYQAQRLQRASQPPSDQGAAYLVHARLVDEVSGAPLSGFKVRVFAQTSAGGGSSSLGTSVTDGSGAFSFRSLEQITQAPQSQLEFSLSITDAHGATVSDAALRLNPGQQEAVVVTVRLPPVFPAPSIADLSVTLPEALRSFLAQRNIHTLGDVRAAGGVAQIPGLPVGPNDPAVHAVDAHADLGRLSSDLRVNAALIDKGFGSVAQIADVPRSRFVLSTRDVLGDLKAARMHVAARAQTAFLDNMLADRVVHRASTSGTFDDSSVGLPERCACEDCTSAVSPGFYLADLLKYATSTIEHDGAPVDVRFLADTFYQRFDALPISCEAVNQQVRCARICVEVLRAYLGQRPLPDPRREAALQKVERAYLTNVYTTSLIQLGTSYNEVRLARSDTDDRRRALADRIGIELTTPRPPTGDELDQLFIDPTPGSNGPSGLERSVESLFGLSDTFRDPLSDGAKFGDDDNARVTRWSLRGAEWGRNTDADGNVHVSLINALTTPQANVYRDAQLTQLVASNDATSAAPGVSPLELALLPENASGLSGALELPLPQPDASYAFRISVVPKVLSWRLKHLRTLWTQEDRPEDQY